ncbi:MAG: hypothetical protein H6772_04390 [Pseudomonadales bacterium]|nr:hypothetical protein [Pseudomonadales bacterium]
MKYNLIKPQIEKVLKQIILKDLNKGRKAFDKPHTEAVVKWMKYLLTNIESLKPKINGVSLGSNIPQSSATHQYSSVVLQNSSGSLQKSAVSIHQKTIDPQVLITAAYAHDWGYSGLFSQLNSNSLKDITVMKKIHMNRGSFLIEQLLHQRLGNYFSQKQILRVSHLVLFHDEIKKLVDEDELLLMEADTLGMLDINKSTQKFSQKDNLEFMKNRFEKRRLPKFIHQEAKKIALQLAKKRTSLYKANMPTKNLA